jgi:hypothetical protein
LGVRLPPLAPRIVLHSRIAVGKSLAQIWSRTEFRCETVAAALALIAVVVLSAIALVDPGLADRATAENGAVEWFQVLLDAAAPVLFGRHLARNASRAGRVSPLDVVIVAALIGLVIGEVDFDRLVFGTKVISTRFSVDARVALPWRVLAAVGVVGVPAAIGIFALVRIRLFWREGWAAIAQPWGRVLAASVALAVVTDLLERQLGHVPGVPHYFLEELFELVAGIGFLVSAVARRSGV